MDRSLVSIFVSIALLLGACADVASKDHRALDELAVRHEHDLADLHSAEADFARRNPMPRQIEVPGAGTIIVREAKLQGLLGEEVLRLQFTWVNTTPKDLESVGVRIAVEANGRESNAQEIELLPPFRLHFGPDCSYTTYVEIATGGAHRVTGWTYKFEATARESAASR